MSFTIPHPPSASSDSGSSASLTPTAAHGYTSNTGFSNPSTSANASAAPESSSLFSSEESKFITDSLSSAESFDPFTIGAPGFKVPSLLPPNIANTHDHLVSSQNQGASAAANPTSNLDLRTRSLSGQQPGFTSSPGSSQDAFVPNRLNSFNLYGHRPTGATPPAASGSSPSYFSHLQDSYGYPGRHASFSGPLSPAAVAAGYGKNKAWQMEQLSFLEAQANRGQQYASAVPHHVQEHRRGSTSMIGRPMPYDNLFFGTPQHLMQQQQQQQMEQQGRAGFYPGMEAGQGGAGLAMLGAQFPSSHNFAIQQPQQQPGEMQTGFSAQALAMLNGDAGLGAASSITNPNTDGNAGNLTPKGNRTSRTPTATDSKSRPAAAWTGPSSSSPSNSTGTGTKRMSTGAPKTAPTHTSSLHTGPSGSVIRALSDLSSLDLDLPSALHHLPPHLHPYFTPPSLEKRTQPHLEILRSEHIANGLLDPNTGLEIKPEPTEEDRKREAEEAEREKRPPALLTTEEKKANHIASEQKRRANIRKGYELLCDIVPSLREALEREAKGRSNDDSDGEDDGKGKKKPSSKKTDEGGVEIDGEKIDGRAGPRSEAVVLMKSLDHIGALVEQYRGLLGRRNRARLAVAKKYGWEGLANQPVGDVDRLLAIKVQEWWANHGDDPDEADEDEDLRFGGEEEEEEAEEATPTGKKKTSPSKPKKATTRKKKSEGKEDDGMHD